MRVVVVGNGMAGSRLAAELRTREAALPVTVLGDEPHPPYNRIMLSSLLAGKVRVPDLTIATPLGIDVRTGVPVTAVNPGGRLVRTADGAEHRYDVLVLATGARPIVPPLDGLDAGRVHVFRTIDDCRGIAADAASARRVLVLGGGLLGIEAARGLAGRGVATTIVHAAGHLMERQLDPAAGAVLARTLARLGVEVVTEAQAVAWTGDGLRLAGGGTVPGDLLVVACGVRPETGLAAAAGLDVGRGIRVDDALRTSDPHIYAIGDCAEHRGTVSGLVAPAWEQAATVADRLTGGRASYHGYRPVTRLKANGVDLAVLGGTEAGPDAEVLSFADPTRGTYARLVISDDRLTGAVLLGDNPTVGTLVQLYDRDAPLPADRRSLLLGRSLDGGVSTRAESPAFMPDQAVVCRCNTVTKRAITACWRAGARDLPDVVAATRATTGCGSCQQAVTGILDWLVTADPSDPSDLADPSDPADPAPPEAPGAPAPVAHPAPAVAVVPASAPVPAGDPFPLRPAARLNEIEEVMA